MNARQKRQAERLRNKQFGNYAAGIILAIVVGATFYWAGRVALNQIDHRVCNTATPERFVELHCLEVMEGDK